MIAMTEDEIMVQNMYPDEDLHGLDKKRICFSLNQLIFTLEFSSNKKKKKAFLEFCEEMLIKKGFKSLDFYDVDRLINSVIGIKHIKKPDFLSDSNPIEKIEFSVESAANFTFHKIEDENLNEIKRIGGNKELNERISTLEKRLRDLEVRMDKFENKNH